MTEINYREVGGTVRVSIVGHALFNPGNDIVCAGVSAITYQMLSVVADLEDEGMIYDLTTEVRDGFVIAQFTLAPEFFDTWSAMWQVIETGYANLAQAYPENVRLVC